MKDIPNRKKWKKKYICFVSLMYQGEVIDDVFFLNYIKIIIWNEILVVVVIIIYKERVIISEMYTFR